MPRGGKRSGAGKPKGYKHEHTLERQAQRRALEAKGVLEAERVLEALRLMLDFNPKRLFDPVTGCLRHPKDWSDADAAALASFEVIVKNAAAGDNHVDTIHKVRWVDRVKVLELAMKKLGMLREIHELHMSLEELVAGSLPAPREP